jgi:hypothetical protein
LGQAKTRTRGCGGAHRGSKNGQRNKMGGVGQTHTKKNHRTQPCHRNHSTPTTLFYSTVRVRLAWQGGWWQGGVVGTGKTRTRGPSAPPTPTEGQKRAGRVNTISPTCACQAHPPFCTGAAHHGNAHYYSLRQAWYVHGRPWQTKKSGAQAGREELAPLTILAKGWVKAQTCVASNHSLLHTNDCSKLSPRRTPFGGLGGAGGNGGHKVLGAVVVFVCRAWLWP